MNYDDINYVIFAQPPEFVAGNETEFIEQLSNDQVRRATRDRTELDGSPLLITSDRRHQAAANTAAQLIQVDRDRQRLLEPTPRIDSQSRNEPQERQFRLSNGARYLVDLGVHPEYATPEQGDPRGLAREIAAGYHLVSTDLAYLARQDQLSRHTDKPHRPMEVIAGNTDHRSVASGQPAPPNGHGTCGRHMNNMMLRGPKANPAYGGASEARAFYTWMLHTYIPFVASAPVLMGSGAPHLPHLPAHESLERRSLVPVMLSARMPYVSKIFSSSVTSQRAFVMTRDEAHSDATITRRMQTASFDSLMTDAGNTLSAGAPALVLAACQAGLVPTRLAMLDPIRDAHRTNVDPSLRETFATVSGPMTGVAIQRAFFVSAEALLRKHRGADYIGGRDAADLVMSLWSDALDYTERYQRDGDLTALTDLGYIEWATVGATFQRAIQRDLREPKSDQDHRDEVTRHLDDLIKLDGAFRNVSFGRRTSFAGLPLRQFFAEDELDYTLHHPPPTRASLRARIGREYPQRQNSWLASEFPHPRSTRADKAQVKFFHPLVPNSDDLDKLLTDGQGMASALRILEAESAQALRATASRGAVVGSTSINPAHRLPSSVVAHAVDGVDQDRIHGEQRMELGRILAPLPLEPDGDAG